MKNEIEIHQFTLSPPFIHYTVLTETPTITVSIESLKNWMWDNKPIENNREWTERWTEENPYEAVKLYEEGKLI